MPVPSLPLLAAMFAAPAGAVQLILTLFLAASRSGSLSMAQSRIVSGGGRY